LRTFLFICAVLASLPALAQEVGFFRLAAGDSAGSSFPIASLIASVISKPVGTRACEAGGSCGVPGLVAVARTTAGSVENVELIWRGEVEAGLAEADIAYEAFYGEGRFASLGEVDNLRAVANLYPAAAHVVVRQDSGIVRLADLQSKRIALGPPQSGNRGHGERVLAAFGLRSVDYVAEPDDLGTAADRLMRNEIDAIFVLGGYPVPAIAGLAQVLPIELLPLHGEAVRRLLDDNPFFSTTTIPTNTYAGVRARRTVAIGTQLLVSATVPADLVYGVTRALWHTRSRDMFENGQPEARLIRPETALRGLAIPLHQGAARYYLESGAFRAQGAPGQAAGKAPAKEPSE
jgi:TRAP transporter TAXI family solute receptor